MAIKVIRIKPTESFNIIMEPGVQVDTMSIGANGSMVVMDTTKDMHIIIYTPRPLEEEP